MTDSRTQSRAPRSDAATPAMCAYLYMVIDAAHPRSGGSRHALIDVDEIWLGRGSERRVARSGRSLALSVPDRWMSTRHARLHVEDGQWNIIDTDSKNGVRVNGAPHRKAILQDRDLVELGHTFFVFRAQQRRAEPRDLTIDAMSVPAGFATLLPDLAETFAELAKLAPSRHAIVIRGPTGSGKELAALAVHQLSSRKGDFVAVNCGALPVGLVEGTLFGHVQGAFSGAEKPQMGLIESSAGGTLFLDEIGDLPATAQAALLRALEYGVLRIGATKPITVDLRVIAATHKDLDAMARDGHFRHDLQGRLRGTLVELPPLADRREDLGLLVSNALSRPPAIDREVAFTEDAMRLLLQHAWPQNIRELVKCIEHAVLLAGHGLIDTAHLPRTVSMPTAATTTSMPTTPMSTPTSTSSGRAPPRKRRLTREQIVEQLAAHRGNVTDAAHALGVSRGSLAGLIHRYGIDAKPLRQ